MEEEQDIFEEENTDALQWDRPHYLFKKSPFIPYVCEEGQENMTAPFNAVCIRLDGRMQADLTWEKARKEAHQAVLEGKVLLWEIELGLFDQLPFALTNQTQYLSLCLSLEHFRDTLWKEFKAVTLGLSLYRGSADFSRHFSWDDIQLHNLREWLEEGFKDQRSFKEETGLSLSSFAHLTPQDLEQSEGGRQLLRIFCRDVRIEYLALLASRLPDALPCYLFLDASSLKDRPLWQAQLLHPERFEHLNLALKGATLPLAAWGWDSPSFSYGYVGKQPALYVPLPKEIKIGICLPSMSCFRPSYFDGLDHALRRLLERAVPFRLIAEDHLITNWDGLDYLLYAPTGLSHQGKRKLQGFCAAGGTVVSTGECLGFPQELIFKDFCLQLEE
ncbi:hypothetical protein [Candidatus Protochlamydia phocaeensis]|uniref:hypothetical protein n=1 Tax=Candidatus Protochlamydia phocaeensis TaxID=1414722 RepID=UPI0008380D63|nr:hypothetical protein [Candidatus Protochlamydia phocaeensis]